MKALAFYIFLHCLEFRNDYLIKKREKLFFVTAGAEGIGVHLGFLILRKPFAGRAVTYKAILESQGIMHGYHFRIFAVTDIACISRGIGDKQQESGKADYINA